MKSDPDVATLQFLEHLKTTEPSRDLHPRESSWTRSPGRSSFASGCNLEP